MNWWRKAARVPGYRLYEYTFKNGKGEDVTEKLFLEKRESLTGRDIVHAGVDLSRPTEVAVTLEQRRRGQDVQPDFPHGAQP